MEKTSTISTTDSNKPVALYKPLTMSKAKKVSKELIGFVDTNRLSVNIAGKNYLMTEAWQFVGETQLGLTAVVIGCDQVAPTDDGMKELKYKAEVIIQNSQGTIISRGFAYCSNFENKKKKFEEYAIASMAQTRAIGKAYRNILGWIVKLAGYEGTPSEEINSEQMESDLAKKKQEVLKALNDHDIIQGNKIMDYIEKTLGKRTIETIDEANEIIRSFDE